MAVHDQVPEGPPILGPEDFAHLRVPSDGLCWWCQERPATTGEHKFKRTDLARLMGEGVSLIWGERGESTREIRGTSGITRDRYGVIKFPKSLCEICNNKRSKPFDTAYETYSAYVSQTWLRIMPGVDFQEVFASDWEESTLNLARYYAKHFGCRMARAGLPVPPSLRSFLDGANDMPDAHMGLITTDTVHKRFGTGLSISPDFAATDRQMNRITTWIMAAYVGSIGVRYEWQEEGIPDRSQFFHFPHPVINCFDDEQAVIDGHTRRRGWFASLLQWANRPMS